MPTSDLLPSPDQSWSLRGRWVATGAGPLLENAAVTIRGENIVAVTRGGGGESELDLGDVMITPGWINAHTHLEFGDRPAPLIPPDQSFARWILELVNERRASPRDIPAPILAERRARATAASRQELSKSGVTLVGEIARPEWPETTVAGAPESFVFLELLGLAADRVDPLLALAVEHVARGQRALGGWRAGLSPHAPYTVHPRLLEGACRISALEEVPVAMHLAESWDELELLASHSGPLVDTLRELDAWDPTALPRGLRPRDYLEQLARASRALIVHGNFLNETDWEFLAARRETLSVVYCPRTHASFLPTPYPLTAMLDAGVRVVLGTDSRATNPDLDFLAELRWVAAHHAELSPERLLSLVTCDAADALGVAQAGRIEPGRLANLTILSVDSAPRDGWSWLTGPPVPPRVVYRGVPMWSS